MEIGIFSDSEKSEFLKPEISSQATHFIINAALH